MPAEDAAEHRRKGDEALAEAHATIDRDEGSTMVLTAVVQALAALAQAHYAAASVPDRRGSGELRTNMPYTLPGVEGRWEIRGMTTENFGATGNVELRLYRVEGS
jgi:hypothetical protein